MKITSTQEREYVENGGTKCPHCGSEDIHGLDTAKSLAKIWRNYKCGNCGECWECFYNLTGIVWAEHEPAPDKDETMEGFQKTTASLQAVSIRLGKENQELKAQLAEAQEQIKAKDEPEPDKNEALTGAEMAVSILENNEYHGTYLSDRQLITLKKYVETIKAAIAQAKEKP